MLSSERLRQRVRTRPQEQRAPVHGLLRRDEQLQGAPFARYGHCGQAGCACCADRGGFVAFDGDHAGQAHELLHRQCEFRAGLRRPRALNLKLLTLLRGARAETDRRQGRPLGENVDAMGRYE